jgi:hypothetical protein
MPFVSQAQQRWMFKNKPAMARRWAAETSDFKSLPKRKKKKKKEEGGTISELGYKDNSPYNTAPSLDIHSPEGLITMQGVSKPLIGIGLESGQRQLMMPGQEYKFDDTQIREMPLDELSFQQFKKGGFKLNPAHKGDCTPMTKSTCTGKKRQFAINAKNHFKKKEEGGFILQEGGEINPLDKFGKKKEMIWKNPSNTLQDLANQPTKSNYTPSPATNIVKGVATAASMHPYLYPFTMPISATGDAYTSIRHLMAGDNQEAAVDAVGAALDVVPFANGATKPIRSINRLVKSSKLYNDGLNIAQSFQQGGAAPRKVDKAPEGYTFVKKDGNKNYYNKKDAVAGLAMAQASQQQGGAQYEQFLQQQLGKGISPEELVNKKYLAPDKAGAYAKFYKSTEDNVYTEENQPPADKPAVAGRGQAIYLPNRHIAGEIFYPSRDSKGVADGGGLNTAQAAAHIKFRNDFGYDGNEVDLNGPELQKFLGTTHTFPTGDAYQELRKRSTIAKHQMGGKIDIRPFGSTQNDPNLIAPQAPITQPYSDGVLVNPSIDPSFRAFAGKSLTPSSSSNNVVRKQDNNLSYLPLFANSIAQAVATKVEDNRQQNYIQGNLANPLNYIPRTDTHNDYQNYGTPTFQEGGMTGEDTTDGDNDYEDFQDEDFVFQQQTEAAPQQEAPTPQIEAPLIEPEETTIDIDQSSFLPSESSDEEVDPSSNFSKVFSNLPSRAIASGKSSANEQKATDYLIQKGLPEHVAAGIVGNLAQESSLNPNAIQPGGNGRGIAQWDVRDRFQDLKKYATSQGKSANDLYTQLDYLVQEAKDRGDLDKIKAATNPSEAAYLFAKHYERPKRIEDVRMKNAERIFKNRK